MPIDYDAEFNKLMENLGRVADYENYIFSYHEKVVTAQKHGHTHNGMLNYKEWFCNFLNGRGDSVLKPQNRVK